MSAPELKHRVAEIDQQVRDVTDYLCSRGDTMPMRAQIEGQVRRAIHGLAQKGWRVVPAARIAELEAENLRLRDAGSRLADLWDKSDFDRVGPAVRQMCAALNKGRAP